MTQAKRKTKAKPGPTELESLAKLLSRGPFVAEVTHPAGDESRFVVGWLSGGRLAGGMDMRIDGSDLIIAQLGLDAGAQRGRLYTHLCAVLPEWERDHGLDRVLAMVPVGSETEAVFLRSGFERLDPDAVWHPVEKSTRPEQYAKWKIGKGKRPEWAT